MSLTAPSDPFDGARPYPPAAAAWLAVIGISLLALMDAANSTIFTLGRASIQGTTLVEPDTIVFFNVAYTSAKLIGFALGGWSAVRFGARRTILAAGLVVLAASGAAGLFTDFAPLLAWRTLQGVAGGILIVAGQSALLAMFPVRRQPFVQAAFALSVVMGAAALTPAIQGWLIGIEAWPSAFLLCVPVGLLGLLVLSFGVSAIPDERRRDIPFDWTGAVLLSTAVVPWVYVLSEATRFAWLQSTTITGLAILGTVAAGLFVVWQFARHDGRALLNGAAFSDPNFAFSMLVSLVAGIALFGSGYLIPAFVGQALGYTPSQTGLLLFNGGLLIGVGLVAAAALVQLRDLVPLRLVPAGVGLFVLAMYLLSRSTSVSGFEALTPALLLRGLGLGFLFIAMTMVAFSTLNRSLLPGAVALFNFGRQCGGLVGVAILTWSVEERNAVNRNVLSDQLSAGNPDYVEQQASIAGSLGQTGASAGDAMTAAGALIQDALRQQVAVLTFDGAFLYLIGMLFACAPALLGLKLVQAAAKRRAQAREETLA